MIRSSETEHKVRDSGKVLRTRLYVQGICSDWRDGKYREFVPQGYNQRREDFYTGYREVMQTPYLSCGGIRVSGIGYDSRIHKDDIETGDLVCSLNVDDDWFLLLRCTSEPTGTFQIVGVCCLMTMEYSEPWQNSNGSWKEFDIA
jgi:hypothetical protein